MHEVNALQKAELERRLALEREAAQPHVIAHDDTILGFGLTLKKAWANFMQYHESVYPDEEDRDLLEALRCTDALAAQFDCDGIRHLDPSDGWIRRRGMADVGWTGSH